MPPTAAFNRKTSSQKYSRRRRYNPDKDVDSINKGNEHFNKKIDRWLTVQLPCRRSAERQFVCSWCPRSDVISSCAPDAVYQCTCGCDESPLSLMRTGIMANTHRRSG